EARGIAQGVHEFYKRRLPRRVVAELVAEYYLDLAVRDVAETAFEGLRYQRRQAVRGERNAKPDHRDNRGRRRQRPSDDGGGAATAGAVFVESRAARGQFGGERGIADLEPRQRGRAQTGQPQDAGRTVGAANVVVLPADRRIQGLAEFK